VFKIAQCAVFFVVKIAHFDIFICRFPLIVETLARLLAMSVASPSGQNRIMIYGPKSDVTYVVEFRTVAGEALAISVPRN
jgi:hypothetical protein